MQHRWPETDEPESVRNHSAEERIDGTQLHVQRCISLAPPSANLETSRCVLLRVLKEVDVIACEDTRQTQKLLNHYGIATRHGELTTSTMR